MQKDNKSMFGQHTERNWRYERKFLVSFMSVAEIESILKIHPALFSELYPQRQINNIYFDSFSLSSYFDNEMSYGNRVKFRIRWYGAFLGMANHPTLEIKIKRGLVGNKLLFPLSSFKVDGSFGVRLIKKLIEEASIPVLVRLSLLNMNFSTFNHYIRKYYQSADKRFRVTIDADLHFIKPAPFGNTFLNRWSEKNVIIVELKYDEESEKDAHRVTNELPFRLTKSSKYVTGVERLSF